MAFLIASIPEVIGFSRPTRVEIQVRVSLFRPVNVSVDSLREIEENVLDKINTTRIASDVYWAGLFYPATKVNPNVEIRDIEISRDGGITWVRENIEISQRKSSFFPLHLIEIIEEEI